jgi:hypothetical protein
MTIDLSKYRTNFEYIKTWVLAQDNKNVDHTASSIALALHMPVIVVYHYIGEILGFTDHIYKRIDSLKKFYNITEVV